MLNQSTKNNILLASISKANQTLAKWGSKHRLFADCVPESVSAVLAYTKESSFNQFLLEQVKQSHTNEEGIKFNNREIQEAYSFNSFINGIHSGCSVKGICKDFVKKMIDTNLGQQVTMAMYIPDKKLDESMNKLIAGKAKATANFNEYLNNIGIQSRVAKYTAPKEEALDKLKKFCDELSLDWFERSTSQGMLGLYRGTWVTLTAQVDERAKQKLPILYRLAEEKVFFDEQISAELQMAFNLCDKISLEIQAQAQPQAKQRYGALADSGLELAQMLFIRQGEPFIQGETEVIRLNRIAKDQSFFQTTQFYDRIKTALFKGVWMSRTIEKECRSSNGYHNLKESEKAGFWKWETISEMIQKNETEGVRQSDNLGEAQANHPKQKDVQRAIIQREIQSMLPMDGQEAAGDDDLKSVSSFGYSQLVRQQHRNARTDHFLRPSIEEISQIDDASSVYCFNSKVQKRDDDGPSIPGTILNRANQRMDDPGIIAGRKSKEKPDPQIPGETAMRNSPGLNQESEQSPGNKTDVGLKFNQSINENDDEQSPEKK